MGVAVKVPTISPLTAGLTGAHASAAGASPRQLCRARISSAGSAARRMVPRSQQGQMIVAKAEGASNQAVQVAPERLTRLEKPNRDVKLGLRFGLHPQTKQVIQRVQSSY